MTAAEDLEGFGDSLGCVGCVGLMDFAGLVDFAGPKGVEEQEAHKAPYRG